MLGTPAATRQEQLVAGNDSIALLVEDMRALGPDTLAADLPAESWVEDWEDLAAARADLAGRLDSDPSAELVMPQTDDGYPITKRMIWAAGAACEEAIELAATS